MVGYPQAKVVMLFGLGALLANWPSFARGDDMRPAAPAFRIPPPGEHPRALFLKEEIPAIRNRAKSPLGEQFLGTVRWQVDYPGKDQLARCGKGEKIEPDVIADYAFYAAATYLVSADPAYLDKARKFLEFWSQAVQPLPHAPLPGFSRSLHRLALTYDWLYSDLPIEQLTLMRNYMVLRLDLITNTDFWSRKAYAMGPSYSGRGCDWGAIQAGGVAMCCLVLEGETPGASQEMLAASVTLLKWIADYSLTPEGNTPNGNAYASTDFVSYFNALWALHRRGLELIDHPHIREMPVWLAYETVPGCYLYDNRNQSSGIMGASPTIMALAARFDGVAPWLQELTLGPERRIAGDPLGSVAALVYGRFPDTAPPVPNLPLHRYSSSMGTVYSRSGWNFGDSCFTITMEPPGQNHTHPDKGSFTFYADGQVWAADAGVNGFRPDDHNSVLIDGKGQAGGQGATDAIVRCALTSDLADLTWMDIKPAFDASLAFTETDGKANWEELVYGRGLPLHWEPWFPVQRNDRWAVYIRHPAGAYAMIVDDIRKDDQPHLYQWLLHTIPKGSIDGTAVHYKNAYSGTYYQAETGKKDLRFTAQVPADGDYRVWILARPWPDLKNSHWFSMGKVNGQWGNPFYLSHYCYDWQWLLLTHGKDPVDPVWKLAVGETQIDIGIKRGARIAQVLLSADPKFQPGAANSESPTLAATVDPKTLGTDWVAVAAPDPAANMELLFLQPAVGLNLKFQEVLPPRNPQLQQLVAEQKAIRAGFAAVLLPWTDTGGEPQLQRSREPTAGQMAVTRNGITDHLFANPTGVETPAGMIECDGKLALVRSQGEKVLGYLLAGGTKLMYAGKPLIAAENGPVSLVNDGKTVQVSAPVGTKIKLDELGAESVLANNQTIKLRGKHSLQTLKLPAMTKTWKIAFAADETEVTVTGDGPRPLLIKAPKAIKCIVNGVSVWFSRAPGGGIYPKLDVTVPSHGEDPPPCASKSAP